MRSSSRVGWAIALLVSIAVHAALAVGFVVPQYDVGERAAGAPIHVSSSLESILGGAVAVSAAAPDERQPIEAVTVEAVAEPRSIEALPSRPVEPATAVAEPAEPVTAVQPPHEAVGAREAPPETATRALETPAKRVQRTIPKTAGTKPAARLNNRAGSDREGNAGAKRGGNGGRTGASAGAVARYGAKVRARILANRPAVSGEGRVVVSFGLSASGGLRYAAVVRSSGQAGLDGAALAAVRRASPFARPPAGASGSDLRFSIPFTFR